LGPSVQQGHTGNFDPSTWADDIADVEDAEFGTVRLADEIETEFGIAKFAKGSPRLGWLVNMGPVRIISYSLTLYRLW